MDVEVYQGLLEFNWNLLFSAVTMLVLYLILKRYFFEKVYCFMMDRQAQIDEQLNHARQTEEQALVLLEEYSRTLAHAEEEKRNILQQARKEADARSEAILNQAKREAEALTARQQERFQEEETKAIRHLQGEIAGLAILAAGQLLERELEADGQEELVSRAIREVAEGKWEMH